MFGPLFAAIQLLPMAVVSGQGDEALPQALAEGIGSGAAAEFGDLYGDLEGGDLLLAWAQIPQPPYFLAGLGLAIGIVCGLTFSTLVQQRLEGWKQDRLALLPLAGMATVPPWIGLVLGVTLFIGGSLQVFGFSAGAAFLVAFLLSLATAGALWVQLVRLMQQVQAGNFKAVDFDNFDEFF